MKKIFNKVFTFITPSVYALLIIAVAIAAFPNTSKAADGEIIINRTSCNSVQINLNGAAQAVRDYGPWAQINTNPEGAWLQVWVFGPSGQSYSAQYQGVSTVRTYNNLPGGSYTFQIHYFGNGMFAGMDEQTFGNASVPDFDANCTPVVNAGVDQSIGSATSTSVTGTATDQDGYIYSKQWSQISGPATASIASPTSFTTGISGMTSSGTYVFRFTAADDQLQYVFDDMSITTVAGPTMYTVTPSPGTGGTMNPSSPFSVNAGTPTSLTVTPNSNYKISSVSGCNGTAYTNPSNLITAYIYNTGNINSDCSVTALFTFLGSMSGTLTPATNTCTIASGASSCTSPTLTWTTTNPVATSAVTNNGTATPSNATGNNSSSTFTVPYNNAMSGVTTFYLYNNSQQLATATVTTSCVGGTSWSTVSSTCAPGNLPPDVVMGTPPAITLPTSSASISASATDPDGFIASTLWTFNYACNGCSTPAVSSPSALTTTVTNMTVPGDYHFTFRATDNQGAYTLGNIIVTVYPAPSGPGAPSPFTVTPLACGTGEIDMSWGAVSGATSYKIYRDSVLKQNTTGLSFQDFSGLNPGQTYTYGVTAVNGSGESSPNTQSATAPSNCASQADLISVITSAPNSSSGVPVAIGGTVSNNGAVSTVSGFNNIFQVATASGGGGSVSTFSTVSSPAVAAGSSYPLSAPYTFPSSGTYSVRLCADSGSTITESNDLNNCSTWVDIIIGGTINATLTASPTTVAFAGGNTVLTWTSTNMATCVASNNVGNSNWSGSKAVNGSQTIFVNAYTVFQLDCTSSGGSTISPSVIVQTGFVNAPDLTTDQVPQTAATIGTPVRFTAVITNIGNRDTVGGFSHFLQVATASAGGGTVTDPFSGFNSSNLAPGGWYTANFGGNFYTFNTAPGTYSARFCADGTNSGSGGVISEGDESNNCGGWRDITVSCPVGTSWGGSSCVTDAVPTVTTPTVSSITTSGATLGANVTSLGSPASISARGTCWGTTAAPTTNCTSQGGTTTGVFTHARTGMSANTTYFYRGYATNSAGTGYSADGTFTTAALAMSGTLTPASNTCTIAAGGSTCNSPTLSWTTTNPQGTSAVTNNGTASPSSVSVNNGSSAFIVPYSNANGGVTTFYLYNNAQLLATATVTTSCAGGTSWNNLICATNAVPTVTTPTAGTITTSGATLGANVTSLGSPAVITARGTCWGTTAAPTTNCTAEGGTSTGVFTQARTGMSSNTTYFYRGYATNATGTGYSADGTFTTASLPMSGTLTPATNTCTINASASSCTSTLSWTTTNPQGTSAVTNNSTATPASSSGNTGTNVTFTIPYNSAMSGVTTFYLYNNAQQLATATVTTSCAVNTGWNGSICATNAVPTVVTPTATAFTTSGATLGANVTSLGSPAVITARGTCWGTTAAPTTNCVAEGGTTVGTFTQARTGMAASTTYFYRGYATNATGTGYSADSTFTTSNIAVVPTVTTSNPSSVASSTANGGGTIVSDGGDTITVSGVVWGTSANPTTALSTKTTDGWAVGGPWTSVMTGLTPSTLYHVRAYATNSVGTSYGSDLTFTTTVAASPSGSISATGCSIGLGASTCNASVTWTTANLTAAATEVTRNNPDFTHVSWLTSGTNVSNAVTFGSTGFFLYHNGLPLGASNVIDVTCSAGAWNGTTCAASPSMSGTITPGPTASCDIAMGASSCTVSLTWATTNPVATSAITSTTGTPSPGNSANNGTQTFTVPYNPLGVPFYLYNNAVLLYQTSVISDCVSGSNWQTNRCVANVPTTPSVTLTPSPAAIKSGASSTLTWTSANADSCTGTKFNTGGATSGSVSVSPTATTTYTITCFNNASATQFSVDTSVTVGSTGGKKPGFKEN